MKKISLSPLLVLLLCATTVWGIPREEPRPAAASTAKSTKKEKVYLLHADSLTFDAEQSADYRVLHGNVQFRKDSMYMYCDSAYFYEANNSLDAFSNVRMEQGDTLFIYGDVLYFDGNEQIARLRDNVRMENRNITLFTDSLNYEMRPNIGYFFDGGSIVDEKNELTSLYGQYSPDTKDAIFNFDVVLTNEKYVIYSDTLTYNTNTKISYLRGPSTIVSDSNTIQTTNGWYDTEADHAMLLDRSLLIGDSRSLTGDTLYYDRNIGFGEAFGNMRMVDSLQYIIMEGQYGFYNEKTDYAFATDSARVMEYSREDTLYLHADTLLSFVDIDSTRIVKAYYGVRFYRVDAQGVCDSMQYVARDTTLSMYGNPIMWSGNQQILGDTIRLFFNDSTIDWAHVINSAFAAQWKEGPYYDQMSGNEMKSFFEGGEMRRIETSGNVLTIFFPQEEDSTLIGMFNADASFLNIFLKDNKMDKMIMWPLVTGRMYPMEKLRKGLIYLPRYKWYEAERPKNQYDIYRKTSSSVGATDSTDVRTPGHKFNL